VAVDSSETSLHAAKYAIVLAKKDDAELIALMLLLDKFHHSHLFSLPNHRCDSELFG
jgi:hypothetical protein